MTAPAFQAAGTGNETSCAWPTHATGDLGILPVEVTSETVSTPSGMAALPGLPIAAAINANTRLFAFSKRATSNAEGAATIPGVTVNHAWGQFLTIRNAHQVYPFHEHATATHVNATTAGYFPGISTRVDDCLILNLLAYHTDSAGPMSSGEANSSLSSLAERLDAGTLSGGGGGIVAITGIKADDGAVDPTTCTLTSTGYVCATYAIAPIADLPILVLVTVDGVPVADGVGEIRLIDITQREATYLVLNQSFADAPGDPDSFTWNDDPVEGAAVMYVPYDDHEYIAVYTDESGEIYGSSGVITFSGGFPDTTIAISTGGGGGGGGAGYPRGRLANA